MVERGAAWLMCGETGPLRLGGRRVSGGKHAVSGGEDGSLVVWHVTTTPTPALRLATDRRGPCASVDLKHDLILCASKNTSIQLWDINGRRRLSIQHSHQKKARMGGAVLLSSSTYVTCASDGIIKFWDHDVVREERLCPSGGAALASVGGHSVIAGHADGARRLWDARSDVCALDMGPRDSTAAVRAVAAEGHFVASLNADHALRAHDEGVYVCTPSTRCPGSAGAVANRVGARRFARRRALCQWRRFGLRRADRGLCDHFATVFPEAPPVNAVAGAWASSRRSIRTGLALGTGCCLFEIALSRLLRFSAHRHQAIAATPRAHQAAPCCAVEATSRQTPRHSANGGVKKCDRPGSSEYSLCRFSATWRASLSGMNGSLSLWNWTMRPAFALMASQRQGRA